MCEGSLIWLLQAVVYRTYSLLNNVGALPAIEELTAHTWEEPEHMVARLELLRLGQLVVDSLLLPFGLLVCAPVQWVPPA